MMISRNLANKKNTQINSKSPDKMYINKFKISIEKIKKKIIIIYFKQ